MFFSGSEDASLLRAELPVLYDFEKEGSVHSEQLLYNVLLI